jgi:hypothetical protein
MEFISNVLEMISDSNNSDNLAVICGLGCLLYCYLYPQFALRAQYPYTRVHQYEE